MRKSLLLTISMLFFCNVTGLATPPNVKVNSDESPYLQNEQQIWVSPNNANNVVAVWRDFRLGYRRVAVGVSNDGGETWSDSLFAAHPFPRHSDPCLTADRFGNLYACLLNFGFHDSAPDSSTVVLYRSTTSGSSWSEHVLTPLGNYFEDKQFTTVDRTGGPYDGNFCVSWTRFPLEAGPNRIMFARSTDDGHSFDEPSVVGPPIYVGEHCEGDSVDAGQFSIPVVDSDGDVHVFWIGYSVLPGCYGYPAIMHSMSNDGGETFSEPEIIFLTTVEWDYVDGGVNVYGMPNGDCDISGGAYDNTIYISQCQFAQGWSGETDVVVRKSTDKGVTWTDPVVVNDDPPGNSKDQFHPWLVVNEDGVVLIIFYDQRHDDLHTKFDAYFSASFDGGETFIKNMRISDVSIDPSLAKSGRDDYVPLRLAGPDGRIWLKDRVGYRPRAGLFAEYIGIHANHDTVSTIWTDTRNGNQDCYAARFLIPFQPPRLCSPQDDSIINTDTVEFHWATCWHQDSDYYRLEVSQQTDFSTVDVVLDSVSDATTILSGELTSETSYFWRVKAFRSDGDSTSYSETRTFRYTDADFPTVESVFPVAGEVSALGDTEISVTFSIDVDPSSIAANTFIVCDHMIGWHTGTIDYSAQSSTATFTSQRRFLPGDIVHVILTEGVQSADELPLVGGYSWSFRVSVGAAPAQFPSRREFEAGGTARDVTAADLDNDGDLDLAVTNLAENRISILWNSGDGTF